MHLLFFFGSGTAPLGVNMATVLPEFLPGLQAGDFSQLYFWTQEELYQWVDDAAKRLARETGCFVERDAATPLVVGTATYNLPARHLSAIHVTAGGRALSETTVNELEAGDDAWPTRAAGSADPLPDRFLTALGLDAVTLYPIPDTGASGAIGVVFHRFPTTVTSSAAVIRMPAGLREYAAFWLMAEARGKEGKAAMPEVSAWFRRLTGLYESVAREYWGGAQ
jgi:hypothetical protein